jgi:predicted nucleic acid-binding protein
MRGGRNVRGSWFGNGWPGAMPANGLIDTGAILALLDRDDRRHAACVQAFETLRLPLLTSEAVLTEVFHLTGDQRHEVEAIWRFLESGAVMIGSITDTDLPALHALMARYWDRPMDFADATLVHLAKRESLTTVFTVDYDDFETYRIDGRRRFRIAPARKSV